MGDRTAVPRRAVCPDRGCPIQERGFSRPGGLALGLPAQPELHTRAGVQASLAQANILDSLVRRGWWI